MKRHAYATMVCVGFSFVVIVCAFLLIILDPDAMRIHRESQAHKMARNYFPNPGPEYPFARQ